MAANTLGNLGTFIGLGGFGNVKHQKQPLEPDKYSLPQAQQNTYNSGTSWENTSGYQPLKQQQQLYSIPPDFQMMGMIPPNNPYGILEPVDEPAKKKSLSPVEGPPRRMIKLRRSA